MFVLIYGLEISGFCVVMNLLKIFKLLNEKVLDVVLKW